jgi:hypothetical protein
MKAMAQAWMDDHTSNDAPLVVNSVVYLPSTNEFQIVLEEKPTGKQTMGL